MKVVSGSLDVLETVGKKTFDVCNKNIFFNIYIFHFLIFFFFIGNKRS